MPVGVTADYVWVRNWNRIVEPNHELGAPTDFARKGILYYEYIMVAGFKSGVR